VLVQEGLAILGIAVGVALLFASQVASTSLTHSVAQLTRQIVGSTQLQLQARGPAGMDEGLLEEVRRVPGVQLAFPVLEQTANVIGPGGRESVDLIGTDPRYAHSIGPLLRRFSASQLAGQEAIALPTPLAQAIGVGPLQVVKLQIGAGVARALVGTTLGTGDIGDLAHSPVALAPIYYAQRLTGMRGRITRIYIRAQPESEQKIVAPLARLAATAGVNVESATYDSALFAVAAAPDNQSEALFGGISALVGFMFAINAMLMTVPSRRRLIEDIRLQGATRPMIVQILLFDAAVIGVLACALGLVLGELLSAEVFHAIPGYLSSAFPVGNSRIVTWQSVGLAIAAGLAAAAAGVLWPLRDVFMGSRPDNERYVETATRGWFVARLTIGLVSLGVTAIILVAQPRSAFIGCVILVGALVCLLPPLFDGVVALFARLQDGLLDGASSALAATELQTPRTRVRSLAIAATGAIAVFGIVAVGGAQVNLQHGLDSSAHGIDSSADMWVSPSGESSLLTTIPFKAHDVAALERVPGVSALGVYRGSFLNWGARRLWVLAQPNSTKQPIPPTQLLAGSLPRAVARVREGGWAVISQALASEHHLRIGDVFTLPSPSPVTLRVAALSTNLGWPPGAIVLSSDTYARAWASSDPSAYEIQIQSWASATKVRHLLQGVLADEPGLAIETSGERGQRHYALISQGLSRLTQIRLLVLIAAILAVAGALSSMLWQRRDLVAFMKCQGYRRGVLWRWLFCESALMLGAGCLIGSIFGLYGQLLGSRFLASATGFPVSLDIEVLLTVSSFAVVSAVAVAIVAIPGYLVVRVPPRTVSPAY
jgi:putative ABC transport system permease protein